MSDSLETSLASELQANNKGLAMQQALFNSCLETVNTGLVILDDQLRYIYINQALAEIDGLPVADHIGKTMNEVVPDLAPTLEAIFQNILDTGKPLLGYEVMGEAPTKPGLLRYWQASYYPLFNEDGNVFGVGGIVIETTERKQAEIALLESEERFRSLNERLQLELEERKQIEEDLRVSQASLAGIVEIADDAIITINSSQKITLFNQGAERIFGYTAAEVIGQPLGTLMPTRFSSAHQQHVVNFGHLANQARQMAERREIFGRRKNGEEFIAEVSISQLEVQQEKLFTAILRDISDRKKVEKALIESEERFRSLMEASAQIVWNTNAQGELVTEQPTWSAFTGQTFEQYKGSGWLNMIHPSDREQVGSKWADAVACRSSYEVEFRMLRHDGEYRHMSSRGVPILQVDGTIREWMGANTDITERKLAEAALQTSEERYRSLIKATSQMVWTTDAEGRTTELGDWSTYTGQSLEEMADYGWGEAIHPEDREHSTQRWIKALQTKSLYETEFRVRGKDRNYRYFATKGVPILDENGSVREWMGTCTDIHDRKQAEIALQLSEERYRSLVTATSQIPWLTDVEGRVTDMPEWREFTGQSLAEVAGFGWLNAIHPEDSERTAQVWMHSVETKTLYETEYRIRAKDGSYRYFLSRGVPVLDKDSNIREWVGTCSDIHDRKQAEIALQKSEERFRSLITATSQIIWTTDAEGKLTGDLPEWRAFTGQTRAEMTGFAWLDAIHPEDKERTAQSWTWAVQIKSVFDLDYRLRAADGSYRYFVSRGVPILDQDGNIREWIGTCTDIHDRKQAEIAQQQSEERYRCLTKATSQMIWMTEPDGRLKDTPDWRNFTGQTEAEIVEFGWLDAVHPEDRQNTTQVWMEAVQTKSFYEVEYRIRAASGDYRYFIARGVPVLNGDGSIREWIGTCADIHDRKLAEQKVRQTLDLLDLASDAVIMRDMSDRIIYWNRGAENLYGWQREEVVGRYIHTFLTTIFPKPLEIVLEEFLEQGSWDGELTHTTRKGEQVIVGSRWTLQRDEFGKPSAQLEINTNITERKLAEQALAQAKDAAEAASRAKSEFLANMSHELRTPLNGILGYAQVLQRSRQISAEERSRIDVIYQCGSHLLTLINDILDLSKIEAQKVELLPSDFHFPAFLQGVAEMCRVRAELKGIQFHYQFAPELPLGIRADEKRLRQVLINLLSNAIKFTDSGSVNFTIAYASEDKIRFEVRDTGVGIASAQIQGIFQPFEQAGDVRRQTEGTGLGLAISQKIVELMGSKIQVQSDVGVGSIFWFDVNLPQAIEWVKAAQTDSHGLIIGIKGCHPKVLVIDDKWENRSVVNNLLAPIGFEVYEAIDGQEGWYKVLEMQPDLVVTDLLMPKLNGFELIKRIRESDTFKDLVIIVSSASVFEADQYKSIEAGGNEFLAKPLQATELLQKIQKQLKLEWIYEERETTSTIDLDNLEVVAPSLQELDALYELAMKGNFKGIIKQAALLEEQEQKYIPFAQKLRQMAKEFQDEKILAFIQSYQ